MHYLDMHLYQNPQDVLVQIILGTIVLYFRSEYHFTFDNVFEICDDVQVLNKLGLTLGLDNGSCSTEDLKLAKELMPKSLEGLIDGTYYMSS